MPTESTSFAGRLHAAREAAGLTQYALAKRSGVSKQALSKLEMGEREPGWETVQRIAAALGLDCSTFNDPAIAASVGGEPPRPRGRPRKDAPPAMPSTPPADDQEAEAASKSDGQVKARQKAAEEMQTRQPGTPQAVHSAEPKRTRGRKGKRST